MIYKTLASLCQQHQFNMLKLTVVISAFLLAACVDAAPRVGRARLDGRIVGGVNANISEVPYLLSLEYQETHICGAVIVHKWLALTAAHCVDGLPIDLLRFRAGSSTRESGGSLHRVDIVHIHPDFDIATSDNNMAFIQVLEPFEFGENVKLIPLASGEPAPGTMALVSGWGTKYLGGHLIYQLQKVMVPIFDHYKCNEVYSMFGGITENMICAGEEEGGKDFCLGDFGSPLVVGEELVGLASWSLSCGSPGFPGIYTNMVAMSQELGKIIRHHPRFNIE